MMKRFCLIVLASVSGILLGQDFKDRTNIITVDYSRPVEFNTLPRIQWITPIFESTGSPVPKVTIEAMIDSHHALSDVKVTVKSGDKVTTQTVAVGQNEFVRKVSLGVTLYEGDNEVTLSITNNKNGKLSASRKIEVASDVLTRKTYANRKDYALIVATDRYDKWAPLNSPTVDAQALESLLKTTYGFETDVLRNPTFNDLKRKLAEYEVRQYSYQDQLFVYFAGHCYFDKLMGFGYLVASNSSNGDPTSSSYLSQIELRTTLDNLRCNRIFLVVDACCADLADTRVAEADLTADQSEVDVVTELGASIRKFINSGTTEYLPDAGPGGHSVFSARLLDALKQKSSDKQVVTFSEINSYFKDMEIFSGSFGTIKSEGEFVFIPR